MFVLYLTFPINEVRVKPRWFANLFLLVVTLMFLLHATSSFNESQCSTQAEITLWDVINNNISLVSLYTWNGKVVFSFFQFSIFLATSRGEIILVTVGDY